MKVLLEIPDAKASFALEVLKSLSFVKKANLFSADAEALFLDLTEASKEVRLHKKGQLKLKTAQELLDEL